MLIPFPGLLTASAALGASATGKSVGLANTTKSHTSTYSVPKFIHVTSTVNHTVAVTHTFSIGLPPSLMTTTKAQPTTKSKHTSKTSSTPKPTTSYSSNDINLDDWEDLHGNPLKFETKKTKTKTKKTKKAKSTKTKGHKLHTTTRIYTDASTTVIEIITRPSLVERDAHEATATPSS